MRGITLVCIVSLQLVFEKGSYDEYYDVFFVQKNIGGSGNFPVKMPIRSAVLLL